MYSVRIAPEYEKEKTHFSDKNLIFNQIHFTFRAGSQFAIANVFAK